MIVSAQNDPTYEYEDSSVEIRLDKTYTDYCNSITGRFARAAAHFCKGSLELGYDECEFFIPEIPVMCRIALVQAFQHFGVRLTWEQAEDEDGVEGLLFYADMTEANDLFYT